MTVYTICFSPRRAYTFITYHKLGSALIRNIQVQPKPQHTQALLVTKLIWW